MEGVGWRGWMGGMGWRGGVEGYKNSSTSVFAQSSQWEGERRDEQIREGLKERGGGMKRGKEGEDKERREGKIGLNKGKCKRGKEGGKERGREV